ncbi:MAG TPA: FAD-dependent oxidoreductase [Bradyrhizobium sp.]|nr:FAD-dependent oxidoreductase [Bradyrhizobium sp.]
MLLTLSQLPEEASFDVVVVGAGGAGMVAALLSATRGLKVLLVEHTKYVGGTTALSAGSAWIPNTIHAANASPPDSIERAATYLRHAVGNLSSEEMRSAFLDHGPKAVAELEARTEVKFRARSLHPDYRTELEGSTLCGRVLEAVPFDGRKLGNLMSIIREPIPEFTVLGGMMVNQEDVAHLVRMSRSWTSFRHGMKIILRHARDRLSYRRGTRLMMGNALVGRLLFSLDQQDVPILIEAKVTHIDAGSGRIGAVSIEQHGQVRRIEVKRGLVMATGGFNRHPELRNELLRKPVAAYCPGAPGHTGQLHELVAELGARYGDGPADSAFWAPVSVRQRPDGSTAVFPHFLLDRGKPGIVAVNAKGRRFVNEAVSYHPFVEGMYQLIDGEPSIPAFLITDANGLWKYGLGMVRPGPWSKAKYLADGYLVKAGSLKELAAKLGVTPDGLAQTVERMNFYAKTGVDEEFGRGSTDYQRITAGDLSHKPNPCLGPIEQPPFYAVKLYPGDIGASRGFVTDSNAQVLAGDNTPIVGLYACGNDMNSVMGGKYPGPGITIGPGIAFAYAAVNHLSRPA